MILLSTPGWEDYELIDSGNGERLERFEKFLIRRPDPQILWKPRKAAKYWNATDASFERTSGDKGQWKTSPNFPEKWQLTYKNLSFYCKLSPFKHTGVFPEQSIHWDWVQSLIKSRTSTVRILNLFGYTGIASLAAAAAGAEVTHVDASYPAIGWARENQELSTLSDKPIRWIEDDALKFVEREIKRGVKYDGILMDPPVYGHGPKGETWDFEKSFPALLESCIEILSEQPLFVLINAYAISASSLMLENVLRDYFINKKGIIESGELALEESGSDRLLSTGIFARWSTV